MPEKVLFQFFIPRCVQGFRREPHKLCIRPMTNSSQLVDYQLVDAFTRIDYEFVNSQFVHYSTCRQSKLVHE